MASEDPEAGQMEIKADGITAQREFYVHTGDPFAAPTDSDLPSPGDPLPHWPRVTAKRLSVGLFTMTKSKVTVFYNNKSLSEEDEGHIPGETRERWSWETERSKTTEAPDGLLLDSIDGEDGGTFKVPDSWSGDPSNLEATITVGGDIRRDVGAEGDGANTQVTVPVLHYTIWLEAQPDEETVSNFYNKVNHDTFRGYGRWKFHCRGAELEKETNGTPDWPELWKLKFKLALLDVPGGWQHKWRDKEKKRYTVTVDGTDKERVKKVPTDPPYISVLMAEANFDEIEDLNEQVTA